MNVFLQTDRLHLRQFTDTDVDGGLLLELDSDPEVMRYIGPSGLASIEAYRERIRTAWLPYYVAHSSRGIWAAIEKDSSEFIGWFFLRPSTDYRFAESAGWTCPTDIEIGYRLRKTAWGRGLATEVARKLVSIAFDDPTVTSLVACALVGNRASTRVMEKVGMSRVREFMLRTFTEPCVMYAANREGGAHAP